jgi:hypothetical protein
MAETGFERLLVCKAHGTMYKMRPYDGAVEYDMELRELCDRHNAQVPDPDNCRALIFRIDPETASKIDFETAFKKELEDHDIYIKETRDDLKVEALKCYNRHDRPKEGCIDWCAESKTIGRKTGVPPSHRQYLCMYCPVGSWVAEQERKAMGMYGK